VEDGEANPPRRSEREAEAPARVEVAAPRQEREPSALPLPVTERLALVELRHSELIEDERAASPELELGRVGQAGRELEVGDRAARLGARRVERLHVVGDDLVDDEAVRADAN
jgi:hypothetical protein